MMSEGLVSSQQQNLLCSLSSEVLEEILDYNVDVSEVFKTCLLLRSLSELVYRKRWDRLKKNCTDSYYICGMIDAAESSGGYKLHYKSFRDIYKRLLELSGISPGDVKPEGVDITNCETLLAMDKRAREIQDKNLLLAWTKLREIPGAPSIAIDKDSDVQKIRDWFKEFEKLFISTQLVELDLSNLGLTCLPVELSHFRGLSDLNVDCNEIRFIDPQIFRSRDFQELNLSNNQLSELDPCIFKGVSRLHLNNNKLTKIDLSGTRRLWALSLSNNQLSQIDLPNVFRLGELDLSENGLDSIDLSGFDKLWELNLSRNKLREVKLPKSEDLRHLNVSDNGLLEIDLSYYPKLREVSLANNKLSSINLRGSELNILDLHGNKLNELDITYFFNLKWLDLSDNNLASMVVCNLNRLEYLNLRNNKLKHLKVPESDNLRWLYLSGNEFDGGFVRISTRVRRFLLGYDL